MSEYVLEFGIWPGPGRPPRSTISSPVDRMPTRGRLVTTHLRPAEGGERSDLGGAEEAAGLEHRVARPHVLAARPDSNRPIFTARGTTSVDPSRFTSSWGMTLSAPSGKGSRR